MSKELVKQDINFLEYPLWFQDKYSAHEIENGYAWEEREGFMCKTRYKPPVKIDQIFLLCLLFKSQKEGWKEVLELSRFEVLKGCQISPNKTWYNRLEDSLRRWRSVEIEFQGTFYDGENYQTMNFGIIDSWSIHKETKRLTVRFSPEWLAHIQHSNYFKMLDFEQLKRLRSPLALRMYELLVKSFQGREVWQIGAKKLARKIPMSEQYPAHIIPKIKTAVGRICKETELQIQLEVKRPERGKAILVFRKLQAAIEGVGREEQRVIDLPEEKRGFLGDLLSLLPEKERTKQTLVAMVERALREHDEEYVRRNILYVNKYSKRSYRVYLSKALSEDWAADWWREKVEVEIQEVAQQEVEEAEKVTSSDELQRELEEELEKVTAEFLQLAPSKELSVIENHLREKVEQDESIPEGEEERHFKWRLLGILQSGIQHYQKVS